MAEIITCPQCKRPLSAPEEVLGQLVQCPSCQTTFTAELPAAPRRPVPPPRAAPEPERPWAGAPRGREEADEDYPPRRYEGEGRGAEKPHRGLLILTLGFLGLCLSCVPPAGWLLGGAALAMGNADLAEMRGTRMDPSGRGLTETGRVCGVTAVIIASVSCLFCCLPRLGWWF
jgi:hypothetical protein